MKHMKDMKRGAVDSAPDLPAFTIFMRFMVKHLRSVPEEGCDQPWKTMK